ncbi:MAG: hypothetical protein H5T95_14780, partial [Firmicutes bacterium]|nr:hypothetical protein [Bacillota bacterium]
DLTVFDFKTGAYLMITGGWFRELGGIGSGKYFWVQRRNSNSKVSIQVGSRFDYGIIPEGQTHIMGRVSPVPFVDGTGVDGAFIGSPALSDIFPDEDTNPLAWWIEGAWEYVDEDVSTTNGTDLVGTGSFPQRRLTARVDFEEVEAGKAVLPASTTDVGIWGRFENNDTLVLIARDRTDERNIDQDQVKIVDTVAE